MPKRQLKLDIAITGLIPDREMRITALDIDEAAMAVRYRITPALPDHDNRDRGPWLTWDWSGTDDLGNSYDSVGGAYGTSDAGDSTLGDLSLSPAPASDARVLRLLLAPFLKDEGDLGTATADIPLTVQALANKAPSAVAP
jgi:hypothetical protein